MAKAIKQGGLRQYLSLILLFMPAILFGVLLLWFKGNPKLQSEQGLLGPWQFWVLAIAGIIGTIGGVLDWMYHRNPLNMKIPKKERDAEAAALGVGGLPMFILMWLAMMSDKPLWYLIPIIIVLVYTVTVICYDEFVFHIKRCTPIENAYHRTLVFGNGIAWLAWFHFIYVQ